MRIAALGFVTILSLLPALSCSSSRQPAMDARVAPVFAAWNRNDSPGCGVGVGRDGAVIFERGYGMASLEDAVPITSSTVFQLASITKAFTAMSLLMAADEGVLSLDHDVATYVPHWSIRDHGVTIRQVLTHTSGLRDAYTLLGWMPAQRGAAGDAIEGVLARQRGLNFAPGAEYQYNNGGYNLLGTILERASGRSLSAYAAARIFAPLGMTGAHFNGEPAGPGTGRASAYSPTEDGWRRVPDPTAYAGNGGMVASVRDLLLWAGNFFQVRVGSRSLLSRMQTATVLTSGQTIQSGMGLGIGTYRGLRTLRTSGGDLGIATELVIYPDQRVAIAVLCNMDSVVMGGLARVNPTELTDAVADLFLEGALEARAAPAVSSTTPAVATLSEHELKALEGLYRVPDSEDHIVSIAARDGRVVLRDFYGDNYDMAMEPVGPTRFQMAGVALEFAPADRTRPRAWHVLDGAGQRVLELALVDFAIPAASLQSFTGSYRSEELDVTYAVTAREGDLVVQSSRLRPVAKDTFVGDSMGTVRFTRDAGGAVAAFTLNRAAARGIRFERLKKAG